MNKIEFVDQTLRDAQQSLWGYMMRTDMITPIAERNVSMKMRHTR